MESFVSFRWMNRPFHFFCVLTISCLCLPTTLSTVPEIKTIEDNRKNVFKTNTQYFTQSYKSFDGFSTTFSYSPNAVNPEPDVVVNLEDNHEHEDKVLHSSSQKDKNNKINNHSPLLSSKDVILNKIKINKENNLFLDLNNRPLPLPNDDENNNTVKTIEVNATFGEMYSNNSVNVLQQVLFIYHYEIQNKTTAIRVSVTSDNFSEEYPVMCVARQQESILSWQIPLAVGDSYLYKSVSRTLCPIDESKRKTIDKNQRIYLTVSSMCSNYKYFHLTANILTDFEITHEVPRTFNLTVWEPTYFMYTFPAGVSSVLLKVTSQSHICMTVSVQKIKCPVFDLANNVEFEGKHQTMSTQAAMFLEKDDYDDQGGFYVVFIVKPDNEVCEGFLKPTQLMPAGNVTDIRKVVTVVVKETISLSQYIKAIVAAVLVFGAFYLIAVIIGVVYAGCGLHKGLDDLTEEERGDENNFINRTHRHESYGTLSEPRSSPDQGMSDVTTDREESSESSSLDESTIDFVPDADLEKDIFRTKTALFVSDLARKKRKKLSKTYKLYYWNLVTMSIFYGLPVVQLVITYQRVLTSTGNQDICYYNFACSHPLKSYLSSFNNVFSNIGYVLLGLLFIGIVFRRDRLHKKVVAKHGNLEKQYGIPQHFGLFYAMGWALVMEGVMSACYHVCPSYSNFQFDTSFMYIIACLNMLKIYQSRHPDINAKAHTAYLSMAVIIFIAVVGVVYGTNIFWICYAVIHMFTTFLMTVQVYYMGRWNIDRHIFKKLFRLLVTEGLSCTRPVYLNRFILLLIGNLINWAFAIYGAITQPSDFATYLLAIFIGNLLLYSIFYIIMKMLYKEKFSWLVKLVIVTSTVTWAGSLYFFFQNLTSWDKTPAGSRAGNKECILMEFYDHHDVWHFLSAISLFFSFMILLLLDDDLSQQRRDKIPVF
ncbi:SID1 transmembrane family member 1-like [Physella acuta]|uniref:SID1 transmembrane family member 1-like n=1 Tax=Physella acuta TaxID=109671 RepID=UPI0027DD7F95|nr:SID1 transmembrane family member 1-like [Physella acuta]